jgi:hypothetical protein
LPYKNLEGFLSKTNEKSVRDWILDLHTGSKGYVSYVLHFIEWATAIPRLIGAAVAEAARVFEE